MSHLSPAVFVTWAILVSSLGGFYFYHLWKFDRFRCLDFRRARDGGFKRIMTYSYLVAIPVLTSYTIAFAIIKYKEGFIVIPTTGQVFPKPFELWSPGHQKAYFPLNILWALSWLLEAISHLEELCFWFYLIHSGPSPKPWFKSIYFKIWSGGCIIAFISLITVTVATKSDPLANESYMQFTGSTISLFITVAFLPILWIFRTFVQSVKNDGGDLQAVVRLAKFHDLNIIRTVFRFFFVVPILMLSIDGMRPHSHELNENMGSTDVLAILSGVGCVVQSAITLMIFFPRNVQMETQQWIRTEVPPQVPSLSTRKGRRHNAPSIDPESRDGIPKYLLTDSPVKTTSELPSLNGDQELPYIYTPYRPYLPQKPIMEQSYPLHSLQKGSVHYFLDKPLPTSPPEMPYSDNKSEHSLNRGDRDFSSLTSSSVALTESNLRAYASTVAQVNPLALYFTSPLEVMEVPTVRVRNSYLLP